LENTTKLIMKTWFIPICTVILFLVGFGMVFGGCSSEIREETSSDASAIRQTVFTIQYGLGFIIIALSLILGVASKD
jgi:hypothetical protein